jgi:hypothetical protein
MKTIKLFNGRWHDRFDPILRKSIDSHAYVGAFSKKQAVELCIQAGHKLMTMNELNVYWSHNCWGNSMNGIEPQVGVWVKRFPNEPVKRII